MTSVRILTGPEASHSWSEAIESLPVDLHDSYYRWAYLNLQQGDDSIPHLFTYESNGHMYLSAFLLRTVTSIRGQVLETPILDIETAYGYGGPLATTRDAGFMSSAGSSLS